MPIVVENWEPDKAGGYFIKWSDPSQPVTAFHHATSELIEDLAREHREVRGAPTVKLRSAFIGMENPRIADAAAVELWRRAYEELVDDIKDLRAKRLRHDTPYDVQIQVADAASAPVEWRALNSRDNFAVFMEEEGGVPGGDNTDDKKMVG